MARLNQILKIPVVPDLYIRACSVGTSEVQVVIIPDSLRQTIRNSLDNEVINIPAESSLIQ